MTGAGQTLRFNGNRLKGFAVPLSRVRAVRFGLEDSDALLDLLLLRCIGIPSFGPAESELHLQLLEGGSHWVRRLLRGNLRLGYRIADLLSGLFHPPLLLIEPLLGLFRFQFELRIHGRRLGVHLLYPAGDVVADLLGCGHCLFRPGIGFGF